jgi:PilZ domain
MSDDPWSRPTLKDLQEILESIDKPDTENRRNVERLELSVPAEVVTARGNTVAAMTREISRSGIGLLHRGSLSLGEVTVRMAGDSQTFEYRVQVEWCSPCENGMFISGGRFMSRTEKSA